jgi:hypothetical protein
LVSAGLLRGMFMMMMIDGGTGSGGIVELLAVLIKFIMSYLICDYSY